LLARAVPADLIFPTFFASRYARCKRWNVGKISNLRIRRCDWCVWYARNIKLISL